MPNVLVTDKAVYFDGLELPWYIAENGISFKPGGRDAINRLTVEFFVNSATFLGIDPESPGLTNEEAYRLEKWWHEYESEWFWLGRLIELKALVEHDEFDRIEEKFDVRG